MSKPTVALLGTCDTKLAEILHVRTHILTHDVDVLLIDVGRTPSSHPAITHPQPTVLSHLHTPLPSSEISTLQRADLIKTMSLAAKSLLRTLFASNSISGAVCIGGSGGTSLGASVFRAALPIGFPKIIVSTIASGDVSSIVGETDITMMNSVVDIAGTNSILDPILENAAGMIAGAAKTYHRRLLLDPNLEEGAKGKKKKKKKKTVAITMFGVTTPAATTARETILSYSSEDYEILTFHATGSGGRAMENLIRQNRINGVLDLTTTELADELVGGNMSAGPERLTAARDKGVCQVVSLGALDMVNFGRKSTMPERFVEGKRKLEEHNADVTLMRTSPEECKELGRRVAERLRGPAESEREEGNSDKICLFIPEGGTSMLSIPGGVFEDKEADVALFDAVEKGLEGSGIEVVRDGRDINDEGFARMAARRLVEMMEMEGG